jgi:glycosyltransferase involved in cell wall biosynthesis
VKRRVKVLINVGALQLQSAGIHVLVKELLQALHRESPQELQLIPIGASKLIVKFPLLEFFRLFFWIPLQARIHRVDWVFEPGHFGPFNLPRRIKRMTLIHDLTPILFPQWHTPFSARLQKWFFPIIFKKAHTIVCDSQSTAKDVRRLYPIAQTKIKVIYPGLSTAFIPSGKAPQPNKAPYFLMVSTLEPRKNLVNLLQAFALVKRQTSYEGYQLILIGKMGWKTENFEKALQEHPFQKDIVLPGYVDLAALLAYYRNAAVVVYPSWYEGFGFPVLEGLASGTKVVTGLNSSLPEVGDSFAYYCDIAQPEDIARAIQTALEDKSYPYEAARAHALQFNWTQTAAQFVHIWLTS